MKKAIIRLNSSRSPGIRSALLPWLLLAISSTAWANGSKITCTFRGAPDHIPAPVLTKVCADFDTPLETCRSFELTGGKPSSWAYRSAAHKLPKEGQDLAFKPYGVRFGWSWNGGDGYARWLVLFIDNSGSPSRAEERFLIVEDGTGKPMSKLMTYREYESYKKGRAEPGNEWEEIDLTMVCK